MRLPKKHDIDFTYARMKSDRYYPWTPKKLQRFREVDNNTFDLYTRKDAKNISDIQVAKPDWFLSEERRARRFIHNLGFSAAKGTVISCISTPNPEKYELAMGEGAIKNKYYAVHMPELGIVVPLEIAEEVYEKSRHVGLSELLAHELTHSAADRSLHAYVRLYHSDTRGWGGYMGRAALQTFEDGETGRACNGVFLNEGLASHVEGLYARRYFDSNAPLNSIVDEPGPERPAFYGDYIPPRPDGTPFAAGHDAYTLEMIAWKAHEMGITPTSHTLIEAFYKTVLLDKTLQLEGLRDIPRIINGVKPGLYADLRNVPLDRDSFVGMMHSVCDTVSQ